MLVSPGFFLGGRGPFFICCLWYVKVWNTDYWREALIIYPEYNPKANPGLQNASGYYQEYQVSSLALHFRNRCKLDEKEVVALEAHLHWFLGCDSSWFKEYAYQHFFFSGDREGLLMMVWFLLRPILQLISYT